MILPVRMACSISRRREPARLDALVFHGRGFAGGQAGGEEDSHFLGDVAGAGIKRDELLPVLGAIAGLFDKFALGGLERCFALIQTAGR